jgi:lysophospholipase L1-like esterase
MSKGRASIAKLIAYNALVFFVLLNLIYWSVPVFGELSRLYKTSAVETWFRTVPPSYSASDHTWVRQHWIELNRTQNLYKSYIGWRRAPFQGETINVEGRYLQRRTANEAAVAGSPKVYFFGGSTMWGIGSPDADTIPSWFARINKIHAENFGEDGWVAHQSLSLLIQLLQAGHRPDLVVFYDGVNDALQKCRSELPTPDAHERELEFDDVLRRKPDSFAHFIAPIQMLALRVNDQLGLIQRAAWYDCDRNPQKAAAIADSLIEDWRLAKRLVEETGGKFVGILQPVAYLSRTRLDQLRLSKADEQQYGAVYPVIREKVARGGEFHDLSTALDIDEHLYVDWAHLPPKGNRIMAQKISEVTTPLGFGPRN